MLATFAVWLLILLPVGQQLKPVEKNDTAPQKTGITSGRVVVAQEKNRHDDAEATDTKKRAAAKPPVSPVPQQSCPLWVWVKSLSNASLSLIVNALYLLTTVGILLAMLKSNRHAEDAYKKSKTDTETSLGIARDAANAATHSNELTTDFFIANKRPWVSTDISLFECCWNADGFTVTIDFLLKNTGETPALNVEVSSRFHTIGSDVDTVTAQRMLSEEIRLHPIREGYSGNTLFPGDKLIRRHSITYTLEDIRLADERFARQNPNQGPWESIFPQIIGCIDYRFVFGAPQHHQTGFILDLFRVDLDHPELGPFVIPKRVTDVREPVNDIRWAPSFLGSGVTD